MQYKIGTCTCTNGSAVVTGQNTLWLAEVSAGDSFKAKDDNVIYTLLSVNSNTQVTLTSNYSGTTQSNIEYQIARDFTPNFDLGEISAGDIDWPTHLTINTIRKIDTALANNREKIYEGDSSVEVIDTGSDGRIIFTTDGAEVARITNAGRLGIGTATPGTNFDVVGRGRFTTTGSDPTSGSGLELMYHTSDDKAYVQAYNRTGSAYKPLVLEGSSVLINYNSGGSVGIGTFTPSGGKLDVVGTIKAQDTLTQTTAFLGVNNTGGTSFSMEINDSDNTIRVRTKPDAGAWSAGDIIIDADSGNIGLGTVTPTSKLHVNAGNITLNTDTGSILLTGASQSGYISSGYIGTSTAHAFYVRTNGSDRIAVLSGGDVGIGTVSAEAKLHIAGSVLINNNSVLSWKDSGGALRAILHLDSDDTVYIDNPVANETIMFRTGSSYTQRMSIVDSTGNVGIGTASPDSKALLDLTSTTKGLLPPRMTTTQRDAITSPPTGLTVFNTTTNKINVYSGSSWGAVVPATNGVIQIVNTQTGAVATGTTTVPFDDTIPQNTEGDQYLTLSVTPKNTNNNLVIDVSIILSTSSSADYLAAALFKDSDAGALASTLSYVTGDHPVQLNFKHKMAAGTTSAIAFKVRAGTSGAGTTTLNGQAGVRKHGGVLSSSITITEISN